MAVPPRIETEARKKFVAWMSEDPKHRSRGFIARSLGVSQPAVTGWVNGDSRPEADLRPGIQVLTGGIVHPDDWKLERERAREATALRLATDAISRMEATAEDAAPDSSTHRAADVQRASGDE